MRKILHNQHGQVMMFGLFVCLLMFLFIGLFFNIGVVVIQKMQMQNAADAAALSGAVVQARGLTWMTHVNEEIANIYADANWEALSEGIFDSKQEGRDFVDALPQLDDIQDRLEQMDYINRSYPQRARNAAALAATRSVPGHVSFTAILPGHNSTKLTNVVVERHGVNFLYWWGILPLAAHQDIDSFVHKDPNTTTYFVAKVTGLGATPDQLMSGTWFGGIPPITCYAAAKPYGGWLLSPLKLDLSLFGVEFSYPYWPNFTLPVIGTIDLRKHSAYLVRIGDRKLHPRPSAVPNYTAFQH